MEPFRPLPQCHDCLMSLARNAAALANAEDPDLATKAESLAEKILTDAESVHLSSPQIANRILREIHRLTGVSDPYSRFKAQEMAKAREILFQLKDDVGEDLRSRVNLALLGNSLDFFKNPEKTLAQIPARFRNGISLFRDDVNRLEDFLEGNPGLVLYLTDNAGEIYFDLPLFDSMRQRSKQTILVVKGGAALNDLTRAELQSAKLEDRFGHVADTGTDGAGIDWGRVSQAFLDLVASADLIVSKGMANFETLYPKELTAPVFFLFKVKCEPVQDYIEAPVNSFLALWKKGEIQ